MRPASSPRLIWRSILFICALLWLAILLLFNFEEVGKDGVPDQPGEQEEGYWIEDENDDGQVDQCEINLPKRKMNNLIVFNEYFVHMTK